MDACLAELAEDERDLLIRHFLQQKTQAEVAAELGLHQPAVSKRIAKAVEKLRRNLAQRTGGTIQAAGLLALFAAGPVPDALLARLGKVALAGVRPEPAVASSGSGLLWVASLALACVSGLGLAAFGWLAASRPSAAASTGAPGSTSEDSLHPWAEARYRSGRTVLEELADPTPHLVSLPRAAQTSPLGAPTSSRPGRGELFFGQDLPFLT